MADRKLRRSQLIYPYGVGSIFPCPNEESLIIAGIDTWDNEDSQYEIEDLRLAKRIRVNSLRMPPEFIPQTDIRRRVDFNKTIYSYRFPQWFYCPTCKFMMHVSLYKKNKVECSHENMDDDFRKKHKPRRMIPERFIVACPEGHIMDFPFDFFVHSGSNLQYQEFKDHKIKRIVSNESVGLSGIAYVCEECYLKRSLSGMMSKGSLKDIRFRDDESELCPGYTPWLGERYEDCKCKKSDLMVVQRGGTNVWYSEVISSINIPLDLETEADWRVRQIADDISPYISVDDGDADPDRLIRIAAKKHNVDFDALKKCVEERIKGSNDIIVADLDEDSYRKEEYEVLSKTCGGDNCDLFVKNISIEEYNPLIRDYFSSISLVYKLKETRALIGFSRLTHAYKTIDEFKKQLSLNQSLDWVPAIETYSEGIFIKFNKERIDKWKKNESVLERCVMIADNFNRSFYGKNRNITSLNPEYLLIHTFAHLLIKELGKSCGYGSSSLKERLYVSKEAQKDMYGVLIYTASGDAEGSLGGLVREGGPYRLENYIISALKEAEWCSADPLCIESKGQGPDSCNLAACHNCVLLPETCCETGNRTLDRGLIIDVSEDDKTGFFQELIDKIETQ